MPALKFTYMSDDYSDYYFGVSQVEMTPSRPEYQPGSVVNTWAGFTVGYRLSPQWLLTSTVGLEFLDSAVTASPIVDRDQLWSASVGLARTPAVMRIRVHSSFRRDDLAAPNNA